MEAAEKNAFHPIDSPSMVPDVLKKNIFWILTSSPADIHKFRLARMVELRKLVADMEVEDEAMISSSGPHVKAVLIGKMFASLKKLLENINYPDTSVADEASKGFSLTGDVPRSNVFPSRLRPASFSADQLKSGARHAARATLANMRSSGDAEIDSFLHKEALEECGKHWLRGPFSHAQLCSVVGTEDVIISRRFGVKQGQKIRGIDDLSESMVNSTVTSYEKAELHSIDENAALVKLVIECLADDRSVNITLEDGAVLNGTLQAAWSITQARTWLGRTFDLKSAYRQLATDPSEAWAHIVAVWNPHKRCAEEYIQDALPFGGIKSVYAFLRCAHSLWAVAADLFRIVWLHFLMTIVPTSLK